MELEVECVANYFGNQNEYFVIKPVKKLEPMNGPFALNFYFIQNYTGFDNGKSYFEIIYLKLIN